MCGIAGILGTSDGFAVDEELVTTMRELIHHRGPDDGGSWTRPRTASRSGTAGCRSSTFRRRPPADVERGRHRLDHVQRRDLQPHGAPRPSSRRRATLPLAHRHRDDRPPVGGGGHPLRRAAPRDVRLRDLGLAHDASSSSPATGSASSRSTTRSRPAASSSARRSRRCSRTRDHADLDEEAFFHYLTFVCTPAPLTMFKGIRKLAPAERMTRQRGRLDRGRDLLDADVARRRRREVAAMDEPSSRSGCSSCCASRSGNA